MNYTYVYIYIYICIKILQCIIYNSAVLPAAWLSLSAASSPKPAVEKRPYNSP